MKNKKELYEKIRTKVIVHNLFTSFQTFNLLDASKIGMKKIQSIFVVGNIFEKCQIVNLFFK